MNYGKIFWIVTVVCLLESTAFAAESFAVANEIDIIYGKGVHAFFDRNYKDCVKILSQAEKMEGTDPRPYYFLGLAHLRQKETEQAEKYFKRAARFEYQFRGVREYDIADALRRIQGEERLRIEKIRSEARAEYQKEEQHRQEILYGQQRAADKEIVKQTLPSNQKEDLVVLQKIVDQYGENAFGAKPMDPLHAAENEAVTKKSALNPFGKVVMDVGELAVIPEEKPTEEEEEEEIDAKNNNNKPNNRANNQGNQAVGVGGLLVNSGEARSAAARELGKGFRSLFSKKKKKETTDSEESAEEDLTTE